MPEDFDFEIDRVAGTIRDKNYRTVLLQFPEGLKRRSPGVAITLASKTDALITISGEPCFGACDIPDTGAELVVHYGHLPVPSLPTTKSVMYVQARSDADPLPVLGKALPMLGGRVGLLTTAQHIHLIDAMAKYLEDNGIKAIIGKGDGRLYSQGQILGCNASAARAIADKVDSFLDLGTGDFHPLAIALSTSKPVLAADPLGNEVRDMAPAKDRVLRQRFAAIEKARQAQMFGILISTKAGQRRMAIALRVQELLTGAGLVSVMVEMDLVTPDKLNNIGLDAWISTACPRLAIDDYVTFPAPVLTPQETEILVGKRPWNGYVFDEIA